MATQYDASILQAFVDDLYRQARNMVLTTAVLYALVALAVGATIVAAIPHNEYSMVLVAVFGAIGAGIGAAVGRKKAFELKFKAQQLLCQMQIEKNTRVTPLGKAASSGL